MKYCINIIDDEKNLNDLVRTYLEKEGYEVHSFYTYDEAHDHIQDDVHLWIVDIMLDKNSGFDLLSEIKSLKPDMPVVFMSARDQEFDRIIGLEKGSDEYITKPFNTKELVLRIGNILKRVYKNKQELTEVDSYLIDETKRKVTADGKEIELTTKEYELLLYFVKNKGLAISREQVLTKVWDENYFGSDRVVDDTLRRLRKKMPNINIKTIYGFGYRLD
ncbi:MULTISPECIES: response regulator transcription factor [Kandleria]|jgi:two-component system response regulator CssR|uniref:Two component response regulator n=1 Tax=Kandleria vitulina DSM 20405 TaxID=1410657 RepID=A0A0R2H566_9FIRM|nr:MULTISPECIES: response regulator transcription factor [Kandleria]KRN47563.1 two component response regulator [Kandleria vitulina DSM 20405]MBP3276333.1 response regulator transcription factor [Kandleria sp.]MEE0989597.1 response regulator transcription factor [Kandleria vitulina]SDL71158.1 two-component system, OmpR family, response regulator CssR [Kandleria vitulina]SEJ29521.1 two-component system, OmpR family, response regulator CssR [Kandleria vitulina]